MRTLGPPNRFLQEDTEFMEDSGLVYTKAAKRAKEA